MVNRICVNYSGFKKKIEKKEQEKKNSGEHVICRIYVEILMLKIESVSV